MLVATVVTLIVFKEPSLFTSITTLPDVALESSDSSNTSSKS
jgi:hypothetical protein